MKLIAELRRRYNKAKRQTQWALLIAKNPRRDHYPDYKGKDYEGPTYALSVLRHEQELNQHYGATPAPRLYPPV